MDDMTRAELEDLCGKVEPEPDQDNGSQDRPEAAVIAELAKLSPFAYDRCREEKAKELGIRVTTLDKEVAKVRGEAEEENENGQAVVFEEPEPWPDPVNGEELLTAIAETFSKFIVLPKGAADAMALWTLHTYAHDAARVSPILAFSSPEKRCGKTTALSLLGAVVLKPLPASNITAAALFRATE